MKVAIINNSPEYQDMFEERGWKVVPIWDKTADLVQFTGGEDVTSAMYGEEAHPFTHNFPIRDKREQEIFFKALTNGTPMAGICRGGQFLNVVNGGSLYQHVYNHAIPGTHEVIDLWTRDVFAVSSTHHQMFRPSPHAVILAVARPSLSCVKEHMVGKDIVTVRDDGDDVEVVFYPKTKSLCFQPHPEFFNVPDCRSHYFRYIEEYLFSR